MQVEAYMFFNGRCEEALNFYQTALGAEVTALMRYKDCPDPDAYPPGAEEKVMHANLRIGDTTIMASDGSCEGELSFSGFSLSVAVDTREDAERFFSALATEGQVEMPLAETFWAPLFGTVTDRFGVSWMINLDS